MSMNNAHGCSNGLKIAKIATYFCMDLKPSGIPSVSRMGISLSSILQNGHRIKLPSQFALFHSEISANLISLERKFLFFSVKW